MPALTLLVPLQDPGRRELDALVASLDGQRAPASLFEVVLLDAGSTDGSSERLARLAAARPHVTHLVLGREADLRDQIREGVGHADGDLVAVLPAGTRPTLDAVSLLTAAGDGAVVGRRTSDGSGDHFPLADGTATDVEALVRAGGLLAVPADALRDAADPADVLLEGRGVAAVRTIGSRACLVGAYARPADRLEDAACTWREDGLDVRAALAGDKDADEADVAAWLVLARSDGVEEVLLPATVGSLTGGRLSLEARLQLGDVPSDGLWSLRLRVRRGGADQTLPVVCPSPGPAVVDGRLAGALVDPDGLVLDLGAATRGVVGRVALAGASVDRTAQGSRLVLPCPGLHVSGDAVVPVAVLLGRFRLRAELVCAGGEAHVECWASGLAGRSRVAVQAGGPRPRRTGLDLVISATGVMSLARTPKKRPEEAPAPARAEDPASRGLRLVRDHLPAAVLPGARRVARTAVGRRVRALVTRL